MKLFKIQKKKNALKGAAFMLALALFLTACSKGGQDSTETEATAVSGEELVQTNALDSQKAIDESLKKELEQGYTFEEPLVVLNPYGNSPLTALVIFSTEEETKVTLTVQAKEENDNVTQTFNAAKDHMLPVYGLYAETENTVVLETETGVKTELKIQTEALPIHAGEITVDIYNEYAYDYGQFTFVSGLSGNIYAIDSAGDVRWFRQGSGLPFKLLENGHVMYGASQTLAPQYYKSGIVETDLLGKVYHEYLVPGGFHHDFYEMPNGNLLVASDTADFSTVEDVVLELDRETGEVVYELDMNELLDPADGSCMNRTDHDWFHNNGVWYDEATDTILLSGRHVDAVVGVNKTTKEISWILGDPEGWENVDESLFFTPLGDDFEWQYAQHQVSVLPNGDIMVFDNGAGGRTKATAPEEAVTGEDVYSRAVVYRIDTENMTIKQVFQFGKEEGKDWYSEWVSGAICLDSNPDNLWLTSGAHLENPETGNTDYKNTDMMNPDLTKSTIINHVLNGEKVCEIRVTSNAITSLSYRSIRMAMYQSSANHDYETEGTYLGNLGETQAAEADIAFDDLETKEMDDSWTLQYDKVRLSLSGSYALEEGEEMAKDGYLVLTKGEEKKVYKMFQTVSTGNVSVNGWVSPVGLEGERYEVSFVIGDTMYETGRYVEF